jgi:hypothetical protein
MRRDEVRDITAFLNKVDGRDIAKQVIREARRGTWMPAIKMSSFYRDIAPAIRDSDWHELRESIVEMMKLEKKIFNESFVLREDDEQRRITERYARAISLQSTRHLREDAPLADEIINDKLDAERNKGKKELSREEKLDLIRKGDFDGYAKGAATPPAVAKEEAKETIDEIVNNEAALAAKTSDPVKKQNIFKRIARKIKDVAKHYGPIALNTIKAGIKPALMGAGMGALMLGITAATGGLGAAAIPMIAGAAAGGAVRGFAAGAAGSLPMNFAKQQVKYYTDKGDAENAAKWTKLMSGKGIKALSVALGIGASIASGGLANKASTSVSEIAKDPSIVTDKLRSFFGPKAPPTAPEPAVSAINASAAPPAAPPAPTTRSISIDPRDGFDQNEINNLKSLSPDQQDQFLKSLSSSQAVDLRNTLKGGAGAGYIPGADPLLDKVQSAVNGDPYWQDVKARGVAANRLAAAEQERSSFISGQTKLNAQNDAILDKVGASIQKNNYWGEGLNKHELAAVQQDIASTGAKIMPAMGDTTGTKFTIDFPGGQRYQYSFSGRNVDSYTASANGGVLSGQHGETSYGRFQHGINRAATDIRAQQQILSQPQVAQRVGATTPFQATVPIADQQIQNAIPRTQNV